MNLEAALKRYIPLLREPVKAGAEKDIADQVARSVRIELARYCLNG